MSTCRLYVLRHGETLWNVQQRLQGHLDSALTDRGRAQVERLAERLAELKFAALYCSDAPRARASIEPLAQATQLVPVLDKRLRERHLGVFEGLDAEQCQQQHPKAWARFKANDPDFTIPDGESQRDINQRVRSVLVELATRHRGQHVALMGHGGTLNHTFRICLSLSLDAPRNFTAENASVNVIDYDASGFRLVTWGDVAHLASLDGAD